MKTQTNNYWELLDICRAELKPEEAVFLILSIAGWIKHNKNRDKHKINKPKGLLAKAIKNSLMTIPAIGAFGLVGGLLASPIINRIKAEEDFKLTLGDIFEKFSKDNKAFDSNLLPDIKISNELFIKLLTYFDSIDPESFGFVSILDEAYKSSFSFNELIIPLELCELLSNLADGSSVYNPFPHSYNLSYILAKNGKKVYTEGEHNTSLPYIINLLADVKIEPKFSNPIKNPQFIENGRFLRKFDDVVAVPPFAIKLNHEDKSSIRNDIFNRFYFSKQKEVWEIAVLEHILAQTSGRAFVVVPNSFLYRTVSLENKYKEYLITKGQVYAVISLPNNIFPNTAIHSSILVLEPNGYNRDIFFIDASSSYKKDSKARKNIIIDIDTIVGAYKNKNEIEEFSRVVDIEEIIAKKYNLSVDRYVITESKRQVEKLLTKVSKIKLSDIATIINPQNLDDEKDEAGTRYLQLRTSDIPDFGFISKCSKEKFIKSKFEEAQKYKVRLNDIVISKIGNTGRIGIVSESLEANAIAGVDLIILRFKNEVDAVAYYMLLKSEIGQELLRSITQSDVTPRISLHELNTLEVPNLSESQKKRAYDDFKKELSIFKKVEKLNNELKELDNAIVNYLH